MGQRHLSKLGKYFATEASGWFKKYAVMRDVRYDEDKKNDQRLCLLVRKTGEQVAAMSVRSLPGCCGVALFHSFSGESKAVADFVKLGFDAAKRAGYGQAVFTLRTNSQILDLVPAIEGTDTRVTWLNGKTGNAVTTVLRDLKQAPPKVKDTDGE